MHICEHIYIYIYSYGYLRSFTVYKTGKKEKKGSTDTSGIGVILRSESFYVNQVLQQVAGSISMDGKGGATVPWHSFDGGVQAACLGGDCELGVCAC